MIVAKNKVLVAAISAVGGWLLSLYILFKLDHAVHMPKWFVAVFTVLVWWFVYDIVRFVEAVIIFWNMPEDE